MKPIRLLVIAIFLSLFSALTVQTQTQPRPTPTPATTQPQTAPAKPAPVALGFVIAPLFADDKQGIKRLTAALAALDREFDIPTKELENLQNRAITLTNEISNLQKSSAPTAPDEIYKRQEELEKIKREGTYKKENMQANYARRQRELIDPIEDDIYKELNAYAKQFGIKVVIDVSKLREAIVVYSEDADFTRAFIADYNAKHPATATPTTPVRP